jgi:hypothetical protein
MLRFQGTVRSSRTTLLGLLSLSLVACGGGGSGSSDTTPPPGSGVTFSVNTKSLQFTATGANDATPAPQTITATVTGNPTGTLYVLVNATGDAVSQVGNISISGNSGQGSVSVKPPSLVGIGSHTSTITIRACLNDQTCATGELSGSPQVVNVAYTVNAAQVADTVMPHTLAAGIGGQVVLRGHGLMGVTSVAFGSTLATSLSVVSDSELHVNYPSTLPAGTYSVSLNGGAIAFSGTVAVVATPAFSAQTLTFPEQPARLLEMVYDAERNALFVAAGFSQSGNNKLWRYTYSGGGWSASPQVIPIPDLRDITFSADHSRLLVTTSFTLTEYDAANPAAGALKTLASIPSGSSVGTPFFKMLALSNDGNIIINSGQISVSGDLNAYLYSPTTGTVAPFANFSALLYSLGDGNVSTIRASADGSHVFGINGGTFPFSKALIYTAATQVFTQVPFTADAGYEQRAALDSSANKVAVYTNTGMNVYDSSNKLLGSISITPLVLVINPQGTRAYAFTFDRFLIAYDLTSATGGSALAQVGASVSQQLPTANEAAVILSAISPDGATIFLASDAGIAVVPAPL